MNYKLKSGFTLVEVLAAVAIFAIVGGLGVSIFFNILRGSAKTRVLAEVKQNGNYALGVMSRMIRNAKSVSGGGDSVTIVNPGPAEVPEDDRTTIFECTADNKIASNSASLISEKVQVVSCSFGVTLGEPGIRPAVVTIDFTLSQAGTTARPEEQASVDFKTTVSLRNY